MVEPGFVKGEFLVVWQRAPRPPRTLIAGEADVHGAKRFLTPYDGTHVAVLGFGGRIRQPDRSDLGIEATFDDRTGIA